VDTKGHDAPNRHEHDSYAEAAPDAAGIPIPMRRCSAKRRFSVLEAHGVAEGRCRGTALIGA